MATVQVSLTPEEEGWVKAADAADDGKGISLADVDLNDVSELYGLLNIIGYAAKTRLRRLIRKLQQQPNGKLRCCFCIRIRQWFHILWNTFCIPVFMFVALNVL